LAPIVGRESPSEFCATNRVRPGLCSRERGLSQVSSDLTRSREVGGVFRVTGFFATVVLHLCRQQHGFTIQSPSAGRWPFPRALPGLDTFASDLRGFPQTLLITVGTAHAALMTFASSSETHLDSCGLPFFSFTHPLLADQPGMRGSSSHGVFQRSSPPASASHVRTIFR